MGRAVQLEITVQIHVNVQLLICLSVGWYLNNVQNLYNCKLTIVHTSAHYLCSLGGTSAEFLVRMQLSCGTQCIHVNYMY